MKCQTLSSSKNKNNLSLKALITTSVDDILIFFFISEKIKPNICESSA